MFRGGKAACGVCRVWNSKLLRRVSYLGIVRGKSCGVGWSVREG